MITLRVAFCWPTRREQSLQHTPVAVLDWSNRGHRHSEGSKRAKLQRCRAKPVVSAGRCWRGRGVNSGAGCPTWKGSITAPKACHSPSYQTCTCKWGAEWQHSTGRATPHSQATHSPSMPHTHTQCNVPLGRQCLERRHRAPRPAMGFRSNMHKRCRVAKWQHFLGKPASPPLSALRADAGSSAVRQASPGRAASRPQTSRSPPCRTRLCICRALHPPAHVHGESAVPSQPTRLSLPWGQGTQRAHPAQESEGQSLVLEETHRYKTHAASQGFPRWFT